MSKSALVISGGGAKGAFAVGVLKYIKANKPGINFDVICGTSTGALIAPLAATWEISELERLYTSIKTEDILLKGVITERFLNHSSIFNVKPLKNLVDANITNDRYNKMMGSGKEIFISTVCFQTGKVTYFTNTNLSSTANFDMVKFYSRDEFIKAIVASSDQPVLMPPIDINGKQYVDVKEYISKTGKKRLSVWSAGCSSGEEPYTIAMILKEYARLEQYIDFSITATDISTRVLQMGVQGIYHESKISMLPYALKKEYFQKGKNNYKQQVRVNPDIRRMVNFQQFNLLSSDYGFSGLFDIIFCRNVLIYFEREIQYKIVSKLCSQLNSGGYLFLGHSDTTMGFSLPLKTIQPSIFTKIE